MTLDQILQLVALIEALLRRLKTSALIDLADDVEVPRTKESISLSDVETFITLVKETER